MACRVLLAFSAVFFGASFATRTISDHNESKPGDVTADPDFEHGKHHHARQRDPVVVVPTATVRHTKQKNSSAKPHAQAAPHGGAEGLKSKHEGAGHGAKHAEEEEGFHLEGEHGELDEEGIARYVIIPIGLAIITALFLGASVERYEISWLPESAVTMAVGVCMGIYMKYHLGHTKMFADEEVFNETCATLLTLFLLPILIFESGWSLRTKDFASQFEYIMVFSIIGSVIAFLVVGLLIYGTGEAYLGFHSIGFPRTAFAYASLISATDPVATLATYSALKVDPLLNTMVWGDSTFNDAVAIVLFKVLNNDDIMGKAGHRPELADLSQHIFGGICKIFLGSLCIGMLVAAIFLLVIRFLHMRDAPKLEILGLVAIGYVCFAIGEVAGMSGIIATIFCSIFLGIYARPHLSLSGSMLATFFLKQVACLMDTSVFLLTGFCVVQLTADGCWFSLLVMMFCLLGRAAAVFPLAVVVNWMKRRIGEATGVTRERMNLLSPQAMFMMWHAGLRGAISLTLCMQLGPWVDELDGANTRHMLQTATFCLICVFLLVFGGSTETCLKKCRISIGKDSDPNALYLSESPGFLKKLLHNIDDKVMTPIFCGSTRSHWTELEQEGDVEEELQKLTKDAGKGKAPGNTTPRSRTGGL